MSLGQSLLTVNDDIGPLLVWQSYFGQQARWVTPKRRLLLAGNHGLVVSDKLRKYGSIGELSACLMVDKGYAVFEPSDRFDGRKVIKLAQISFSFMDSVIRLPCADYHRCHYSTKSVPEPH